MGSYVRVAALCVLSLLLFAGSASAQAEEPTCLDPRSDQFDGTALDTSRWSRLLREDTSLYSVADGKLKIQTGAGEVQDGDEGAPNLVLQPTPQGSWQATTKVKIDTNAEGQQAGLLLAGDGAEDVVKATFVDKGPGQGKWFEFLKIVDGNYDFSGVWNSGFLPGDFPDEFWIRLKSDGQVLSGSYSTDGRTWTTIADPRNYEAIENPSVGVYALRGGEQSPVATAEFDRFDLVPADDEFTGDEIDRCRWEIERENPDGYTLGDGLLTIKTLRGELSNDQSTVQNVFVQPTGDSDWQATTKMTLDPQSTGQQGGLVVRGSDASNHSKIVLVRKENGQRWIEFLRTTDGATDFGGTWNTGYLDFPETVYVRLVSDGEQLSGYWSEDGETWNKVGDSRSIDGIEAPKVGPMALGGENDNPPVDVAFDFFHLEPNTTVEPAPNCTTQAEPEDGFTSIFDGSQESFDKWRHAGDGFFTLNEDGSMTSGNDEAEPSYGLHWFPDTTYRNFSLRLQWKAEDLTDNSGVFARFPDPGDDPDVAVNQGHEIQINENPGGDPQKTGSIYNADPADYRNAKPVGEWNDYEITVSGQRYTVCLNGKVVNDYVSDKGRGLEGLVGVQNHDPTSHVSFRDIRVKELPDVPEGDEIFDTIGITTAENRANAQIFGQPLPYAYIAEQMPPSRSVGVPGDDENDDVPVRMPDTRGVVPNLASMHGQQYVLPPAQRKAYSKLHFFGATTDAQNGQASGGDFTLTFEDGTTEKVTVRFRDWAASGATPADHPAITTNPRYTTEGTQGNINFYIFHRPIDVSEANRGKVLQSITLPPSSTPGSAVTRAYLMAMTLEDGEGGYEMPILAGDSQFPDDLTPPVTSATVDPAEPDGEDGWYTGPVEVSLSAADEEGGSQVETTEYRIDGGAWSQYTGSAFDVEADGAHVVQYRSLDRAGNLETQKSIDVKIDGTEPVVKVAVAPSLPAGAEWYDRPATLSLDATDGRGSGVESVEYSVDGGNWLAYEEPVTFTGAGTFEVLYRVADAAGNAATAGQAVVIRIDGQAPTTTARLNGAAPASRYSGPVRVELAGADAAGGSGVQVTEYRLDGGAWTAYTEPFTVSGAGNHNLQYASVDKAGNAEPAGELAFAVTTTQGSAPGGDGPGADPAPAPDPWAAVSKPSRSRSTLARLRAGKLRVTVRCLAVDRATLRLIVSRAQARKLGLRSRVLASRTVRCGGGARATVTIKPKSRAVKRALRRRHTALPATLELRGRGASDAVRIRLRAG
jgi:hypothetical protein